MNKPIRMRGHFDGVAYSPGGGGSHCCVIDKVAPMGISVWCLLLAQAAGGHSVYTETKISEIQDRRAKGKDESRIGTD